MWWLFFITGYLTYVFEPVTELFFLLQIGKKLKGHILVLSFQLYKV